MLHHRSLRFVLALFFAISQLLSFAGAPVQAAPAPLPAQQSAAPWIDAQLSGGIIYLLYSSPAQIRRYDTASQKWLSPLSLPAAPTSFRVYGSDIFVALDQTLARFKLDGTGRVNLWTGQYTINGVLAESRFVFACQSDGYGYQEFIHSLNRATGQEIDSVDDYVSCPSASIAPGKRLLFARTEGIGPADIIRMSYGEDGSLSYWQDSPYHGDYPDAQKTWVSPDESLVVDDSSMVYNTADLTVNTILLPGFQDDFPPMLDDVAFDGNRPVVLFNGTLYSLDDRLVETAQYTPAQPPLNIFITGGTVYALRTGSQGPVVDLIPLSQFQPPAPAEALDAYGLPYTIDDLAFDPAGTLYLMNKASRNILRWSVTNRKYLDPIPLAREPQQIAYSTENGKLYIGYENKAITQVTPAEGLAETPFTALKGTPCALEAAGNVLMTCADLSGYYGGAGSYSTISADGELISDWGPSGISKTYAWSETQSRIYYPSGSAVNWFILSPDGAKTGDGYYYSYQNNYTDPVRLSGDETRLFAGPRSVFSVTAQGLTPQGQLPEDMADAAWRGGDLFTFKATDTGAQIQKWNADFSLGSSRDLAGSPLYLLDSGEGLLAITDFQGRPRFTLGDDQLNPLYNPPAADFSASEMTGTIPFEVQFTNQTANNAGATYRWDFGDGETSAEISPAHTYTKLGKYTVTLTATGPGGEDRVIKTELIEVIARVYLPALSYTVPTATYNNACKTFPLVLNGSYYVGDMTECVPKMEDWGAKLRVYFTWRLDQQGYDCVEKYSDWQNKNMYITDQMGNRYDMTAAGGVALNPISCMDDGYTYPGWFEFPRAKVSKAVFTFHDDDNQIQLGPLPAP